LEARQVVERMNSSRRVEGSAMAGRRWNVDSEWWSIKNVTIYSGYHLTCFINMCLVTYIGFVFLFTKSLLQGVRALIQAIKMVDDI
jgi:hypothetical protein